MKYFWLFLLLASHTFAASHIGGSAYDVSYTVASFAFPYTTAQNASGNYFYVAVGVDKSSTAPFATAAWDSMGGTLVSSVFQSSVHNGIYLWQFSSPSTITSGNVTVTAQSGNLAYPAATVDEFSGTNGIIGGVGNGVAMGNVENLPIGNLDIQYATSVSFSAAVAYYTGPTIQPAGWTILQNGTSDGATILTSAWGAGTGLVAGTTAFTWSLDSGYGAAVAFEMEIPTTPTITPTFTASPTPLGTNTPTPTPTPTVTPTYAPPGSNSSNPFYISVVNQTSITHTDSFTSTGLGAAISVTYTPIQFVSMVVKGVPVSATAWNIYLDGSLDGVNYTHILDDTSATEADGEVLYGGSTNSPTLYLRTNAVGLTLGAASSVSVTVLGVQ